MVFSKVDLRHEYHLIPVEPKDHYKIAFAYCYSSFKFTVMLFGFKNAPSHFLHLMTMLFGNLVDKCIVVYLDNILSLKKTGLSTRLVCGKCLIEDRIRSFTLNVRNMICTLMRLKFLDMLYYLLELRLYPVRFLRSKSGPNPLVYAKYRHFLALQTIIEGLYRSLQLLLNL